MRVLKLVQPKEFGEHFRFVNGLWEVIFPESTGGETKLSNDSHNALTMGSDQGLHLLALRLFAYALVQDNENQKIHLYRYRSGTVFDISQAILVNSIDMLELNGSFDDIAITDANVKFYDVHSDTELVFDTNLFQKTGDLKGSDSVSLSSEEKKEIAVKVSVDGNNLMQAKADGLFVDKTAMGDTGSHEHSFFIVDSVDTEQNGVEVLNRLVGTSSLLNIPVVNLRNMKGRIAAVVIDKVNEPLTSNKPR